MRITIFPFTPEAEAGICQQCQALANSDDLQNCPCGKTICLSCVRRGHTHHQLPVWQDVSLQVTITSTITVRWQAQRWDN